MLEKKKYLLLFILIITVLLLTSGCLYYYPPVYTFGSIEITTNPPGAKIFFDGIDTHYITPYTLTNVSAGTHIIKLTLTDYLNYSNVINVIANQTVKLNLNLIPATPPVFLTGISVFPSTINLVVGESQTISSVTAYYSDSSSAKISLSDCEYVLTNISCATVSNNGTINAVAEGKTAIIVTYVEGGIVKTDAVDVKVSSITQNEAVYRALCVGVGDYINYNIDADLLAPPYDVDNVRQILNQCKFGSSNITFSNIDYLKDWQATKSNILQGISSTFAGADSDDVSYFYFSGHGSIIRNTSYICPADATSSFESFISVDELEAALSAIPGTKVVFIDACHSGGFIGKGTKEIKISQEELESFNDEIINVFSQAQPKGLLTTNQYKVLTSCHYYEPSYEIQPADGNPFGVFTKALCEGCSYSGNYPADTNLDTKVSLQEAYLYVRDWVFSYGVTQDVQVYPNNSTFTIVEY
jgi:hypothetical protein